ncbi:MULTISPECIES: LysE family transporter [unclassified Paenibacillus]|uniref:LysE family translocator n=1 Tax=unclassified Paenibacillus TaxID=185978 RepID=UPI00104AB46B|nr:MULTISPECIES: LysE family transporter [unclassified Paenibacillus]NIK68011.1 threonine/homoserine/homoserine lactone efflux protein [Paenibacillus sp. BK720]TCN01986.1 threonine/homoserine/homoserine lactone efflux protein [Paenibacillus sp. BK033]
MSMWSGVLVGLSIAAPVGPIGVLCMKRTINQGRWYGVLSGLGAASADAVYGLIAAVGFTALTNVLVDQRIWIQFIGGLFLCYLGYQSVRALPQSGKEFQLNNGLARAYLTTFFLTVTNPMTILSFTAIFAGIPHSAKATAEDSFLLVLGIFLGSMLWWLILAELVGIIRTALNAKAMRWINVLSGVVLLAFGVWSLVNGLFFQ